MYVETLRKFVCWALELKVQNGSTQLLNEWYYFLQKREYFYNYSYDRK